jgi:pSer/pThr/pTyr-binding forkhead associated (FHA) protein
VTRDATRPVDPLVQAMSRAALVRALDVVQGARTQTFLLDRPELTLGSGAGAELRVESAEVAERHARLTRRDGEYTCEDLESEGGLFLNGLRVHAAVLRDGDVLQMANVVFIYRERG